MINTLDDILHIENATPFSQRCESFFENTYDVIANAAKNFSDKTAIIFLNEGTATEEPMILTYQQLFHRINHLANFFLDSGCEGQTISYVLPNIPDNIAVLFAAEAVGIANPINPSLSIEQIADILYQARSTLIVTCDFLLEKVLAARDGLKHSVSIFVIDSENNDTNPQPQLKIKKRAKSTDICAYFHTSGTTHHPKLVAITHRNKLYSEWSLSTCFDFQSTDVFLMGMPLFHVAAPMVGALIPFMKGATTVLMSPMGWMNPAVIQHFWAIVEKYQGTVTAGLNFIFSQVLQNPLKKADISSLRLILSTALLPEELGAFENLSPYLKISEIYGLTEITAIALFNPPNGKRKPGSLGIRFPYQSIKIMTINNTHECVANEVGVLWIRGPNVTAGYKTAEGLRIGDAWLNTGDLVYQDEQGYCTMVGRISDMIHSKDEDGKVIRIPACDIENCLSQHPSVARVAVIAKSDTLRGEIPLAFIELKSDTNATIIDELMQWMRKIIVSPLLLPEISIQKSLPVCGIGRVVKYLLKERE